MSEINSIYAHLLSPSYKQEISNWLKEDVPSFDYGGFVVGEAQEVAILYGKSAGVVAGIPFFEEVFNQLECRVEWNLKEGEEFEPIKEVARVYGRACNILLGERTALNILARCSGIATRSKKCIKLKEKCDFRGVIAGTRKTTPGNVFLERFRIVEKYGMLVGGADTHRMDLSSMIMLKDNHIWSQGSIKKAIGRARKIGGFSLKIEVECLSEQEADEAIEAGADIIMLDNMKGDSLKQTAKTLKQRWAGKRAFLIESSGGISEENIVEYFSPDIDILSMGSLSQGVPHVDFSLKIKK
ncbi:nicotinate-nucleotide diphosphorylase [Rhizophagus irregularis]|uniref:Nicotinate-nucleotide pyrophosphorylase [carboxylating] n=2 Tax=Rhizophagus irregularis TaxID=588596 RepID=A0A2I1H5I2_9GLOM|nr:nicotinate-nucleotide diphosphorylase [Rhizophagus irregularis]PKY54121.1 nicotinate-nucleotide diphosphorylase [Rhizophagus irregularis]